MTSPYGDTTEWIRLTITNTIVGDTHTNTTFDDLSAAEVALCDEGMEITGTDIPASTTIASVGANSITLSQAATGTTNDVTATIKSYLYITAEGWSYDKKNTALITMDYPQRGHYGLDLNQEEVRVKIKNIWVATEAEWNILKTQLENAEEASSCTLRIQISSTPTYELFDGVAGHYEMPIVIETKNAFTKPYGGGASVFQIDQILLRQVGALTA